MKQSSKYLSIIGLVVITFLASIQYVFLSNVPDTVSSFAFVCITNVIGLVVLFLIQTRKIMAAKKSTVLKGAFFALLLTGFNVFVLLGSRNMDSVVTSSVVSMYFIFITPLLLLLKKKVNFFSSVATALAIVALLLIFGNNAENLFASANVVYLVIADLFFAGYVVSVSILGEMEDNTALTFSQMCFAALFSLIGWLAETVMGNATVSLPTDTRFWISAIFIGVFIRAVYGLVQISCQKHVPAITASLIFSTEIIMTMVMDPIMSVLLGTTHTPATVFQVIGAVMLILATLLVDETFTSKLGYDDMEVPSISRKIVVITLTFAMVTLLLSTIISFSAIRRIQASAVNSSSQLGREAAEISSSSMISELERNSTRQVQDKAKLAEAKLAGYSRSVELAADYVTRLFESPHEYPKRNVEFAKAENAGICTMQLLLADKSVDLDEKSAEIQLLGNMEDVFEPIVRDHENISTVYMGTKDGVMISYDRDSQLAAGEENRYAEYRESSWYQLAKEKKTCLFTDTYWDSYGRGLTITCVAPFYDGHGKFNGCVAMDILMADLNASMVSDGIVDPVVATMFDADGDVIASGDLDSDAEESFNIFEEDINPELKELGREILRNQEGIIKYGDGNRAVYVAYATISSTEWKLCIKSPVTTVIEPANKIKESIDANTESVVTFVVDAVVTVLQNCLVVTALILILVILFSGRTARKISEPIKQLERDVQRISGGNLDSRTDVDTDDEIGSLARSFNRMTDSLQKHIHDLTEARAKEERIASELSVATNIQSSMLPRNFEEINNTHSAFKLYASMEPAKEVGGDFYDFFFADEDHIALVIADVSGKGVPAALFMVRAKTAIKNRVMMGGSPSEVLSDVNDQLCDGNEEMLFVTVWLAVIELSTGKGIAANAGHEDPAICRKDGTWELAEYPHDLPLAAVEGMDFEEHEFNLYPGDTFYVYTDGVPEATSAEEELYGTDRMLDCLNRSNKENLKTLLESIVWDISKFVGQAEQFDDMTMLGFQYFGEQ